MKRKIYIETSVISYLTARPRNNRGQRHAASLGFDLDRIFADLQARQNKHAAEGWTIIPAPDSPPPESELVLQRTRFARR